MGSRYTLLPFDAALTAETLLQRVFHNGKGSGFALPGHISNNPWRRVFDCARSLGALTVLIQSGVRDPDFLEEHQAFYAKHHRPVSRTCVRVHFFSKPLSGHIETVNVGEVLAYLDEAEIEKSSYLGFSTIRPLRHAPVGATILGAPSGETPTVLDAFPVHIGGNEFLVIGTPFLQQDNAVGACAQASMWMALRTIRRRQGNAAFSPAELTVAATRYLAHDRSFPGRRGLTVEQMLEAVKFAGHDPLHLTLRTDIKVQPQAAIVAYEAFPYIESGLPVIMALLHPDGGHAVVAIGRTTSPTPHFDVKFQLSENGLNLVFMTASSYANSLLIHNDNSGPYLPLAQARPGFAGYTLEQASSLIVTLPDGVFTTASEAQLLGSRALASLSILFTAKSGTPCLPQRDIVVRQYLCARHIFRNWAKSADLPHEAKDRYRTEELPKFVWIMEIHDKALYCPNDPSIKSRCGEVVIDASADPLHADGLVFARVSKSLWPHLAGLDEGMLLCEDEHRSPAIVVTGVSNMTEPLAKPWAN